MTEQFKVETAKAIAYRSDRYDMLGFVRISKHLWWWHSKSGNKK